MTIVVGQANLDIALPSIRRFLQGEDDREGVLAVSCPAGSRTWLHVRPVALCVRTADDEETVQREFGIAPGRQRELAVVVVLAADLPERQRGLRGPGLDNPEGRHKRNQGGAAER